MLLSGTSWQHELVLQRSVLVMYSLWTRTDPKSWDHGSVPHCIACITATVSILVLTVVQLSFSLSLVLQLFSLHLCCLPDRFDHKNIKYRLWTKVHWTVLAAHWFFNFQAVKLPLFNKFCQRLTVFLLWELSSCSWIFPLDSRSADPSPYESFLHECA